MKSQLLFLLLIAGFSTQAQVEVYVAPDAGPLVAIGSSWLSDIGAPTSSPATVVAVRHQKGITTGVILKNRINFEFGFYKQYHASPFFYKHFIYSDVKPAKGPGNDYHIRKFVLRMFVPVIKGKKLELQLLGGAAKLDGAPESARLEDAHFFITGENSIEGSFKYPIYVTQIGAYGAWGYETGLRLNYNLSKHFGLGLTAIYQGSTSTQMRAVGYYSTSSSEPNGRNIIVSNSKGDAALLSLTARYTYSFKKKVKEE